MTTKQDAAAVEATTAQQVWRDGLGEMAGLVAGCFVRRETRQTFREMTEAMLMGVARANCWTQQGGHGHPVDRLPDGTLVDVYGGDRRGEGRDGVRPAVRLSSYPVEFFRPQGGDVGRQPRWIPAHGVN